MKNTKIMAVILIVVYTFYITGCSIYSTEVIDDYKQIKRKDLFILSTTTKSGRIIKFNGSGGKLDDSLGVITGVTEVKDTVFIVADSTSVIVVKEYDRLASYLANIAALGAIAIVVVLIAHPPFSGINLSK